MFNFILILMLNKAMAEISYSFDLYSYAQKNQILESILNPQNQIIKNSNLEFGIDARPEIKWKQNNNQIIIRPRITASYKNVDYMSINEKTSKTIIDITDAFIENYWPSDFSTTLGLQVYQWGPAEFANASNAFYHFNSKQKSLIYKEKGHVLLRANYSPNKENSFVFIYEPISNNEPEWIADDTFTAKALLKYEKNWSETADYVGLVAGTEEKYNFYIGEYVNYSIVDGFSIYADIKHAQNHINFITSFNGTNYDFTTPNSGKNKWPTFGIVGARWEDSFDLRFEYIYNGMGYSKADLNLAIATASNNLNLNYATNLKRFLKPGLELLGQNYIYVSHRINEPYALKDLNFYTRYIYSVQDGSGQMQMEFDKSVGDSYLIFSNMTMTNGSVNSEFRLTNDWQILAGFKWGI